MNGEDERLEWRLREIFRGVDTTAGFEARVMQRIAALPKVTAADLRAQFDRGREVVRRRLRREAWSNAATVAGIGAAAGAVVWRYAPEIVRWAEGGGAAGMEFWLITAGVLAATIAGLWPFRARLTGAL